MFYSNYKQCKMEKLISHICIYEYKYFLNKANVVGVGCGYKVRNGFRTNDLCIQVFVSRKVSKYNISQNDMIPLIYKGVETDVVQTGFINISSLTQKIRPVLGGYAIGNEYDPTSSSTLGCLVTDGKDYFILANNHTIASINRAPLGTKILQPSIGFGGSLKTDVIAILSKYTPIKFIETTGMIKPPTNYVDCAIGKVIHKSLVSSKIAMVGTPESTIVPRLNQEVKKVGFKTELTIGAITSLHVTVTLPYRQIEKTAIFKEQIMSTYMSGVGDSGSLVLTKENYVVGLIMATVDNGTIFNPINPVLKALNVRLVT